MSQFYIQPPYPTTEWASFTYNPLNQQLNEPILHITPLSHNWMSQFYIQPPYSTTEWASFTYNPLNQQLNEPILHITPYPTTEWANFTYKHYPSTTTPLTHNWMSQFYIQPPYPTTEWANFTYNPLIPQLNEPILHITPYPTTEWANFTYKHYPSTTTPLTHNWMSQFYI